MSPLAVVVHAGLLVSTLGIITWVQLQTLPGLGAHVDPIGGSHPILGVALVFPFFALVNLASGSGAVIAWIGSNVSARDAVGPWAGGALLAAVGTLLFWPVGFLWALPLELAVSEGVQAGLSGTLGSLCVVVGIWVLGGGWHARIGVAVGLGASLGLTVQLFILQEVLGPLLPYAVIVAAIAARPLAGDFPACTHSKRYYAGALMLAFGMAYVAQATVLLVG